MALMGIFPPPPAFPRDGLLRNRRGQTDRQTASTEEGEGEGERGCYEQSTVASPH